MKGARRHKFANDAFKLAWAGQKLRSQSLIIAVAGQDAAAYLNRPGAWLTAAIRDANVEVIRVALEAALQASLTGAQTRQHR